MGRSASGGGPNRVRRRRGAQDRDGRDTAERALAEVKRERTAVEGQRDRTDATGRGVGRRRHRKRRRGGRRRGSPWCPQGIRPGTGFASETPAERRSAEKPRLFARQVDYVAADAIHGKPTGHMK